MHDGHPVAVVAPSVPEGSSLPADLTCLADLRVQLQALVAEAEDRHLGSVAHDRPGYNHPLCSSGLPSR
jgi:hypothetical protein